MLALRYITAVEENLGSVLNELDTIKNAAESIAGAALSEKNVYVVDSSGIINEELVDRASGLALFRHPDFRRTPLSQGDILLISSLYPGDEEDLKQCDDAHEAGAMVITISPPGELAENADIALINKTGAENGVVSLPGIGSSFCPISGIMNATLAWALVAETTASIMNQDKTPTVFWGRYLAGGGDKYAEAARRFSSNNY